MTTEPDATVFALTGTKSLRGLLVPYGEIGQNAKGEYVFSAGTIESGESIPLKFAHPGSTGSDVVLGHSTLLEETEAGLVATFEIDDSTTHGKALLADYAKGLKKSLSAEFSAVKREGSKVLSAALSGAATVVLGGFSSAAFFGLEEIAAEDFPEDREAALQASIAQAQAVLDGIGATLAQIELITQTPVDTESTDTETPTNPEPETAEQEEDTVAIATVPNTLVTESSTKEELALNSVFNLVARAKAGDESAEFALSDIKISGTGALPIAGVLQPSWLGQLWQGRTYARRYMSLIRNGEIKSIDEKGFTLDQGTALVQEWAGNKANIPSGTASTAIRSAVLQKWAYGADIAREFFDLPGGEEVMDAFLRGLAESYAKVTDQWTLAQLVAGVGSTQAAATYPAGYSAVFGQLIQGAEAVEDAGDTPTFAILNQKAWDLFKYTPKDEVPEFIKFAFNLGGDATGAAPRVVKGLTGIVNTPSVIVGSSAAAHVNEKSGASPLFLDALDIARGGVDKAVVGYTQFMVDRPESLVRIGTADV